MITTSEAPMRTIAAAMPSNRETRQAGRRKPEPGQAAASRATSPSETRMLGIAAIGAIAAVLAAWSSLQNASFLMAVLSTVFVLASAVAILLMLRAWPQLLVNAVLTGLLIVVTVFFTLAMVIAYLTNNTA